MLLSIKELSQNSGIPIISFGHAGDGNIHVNILVTKGDEECRQKGFEIAKKYLS